MRLRHAQAHLYAGPIIELPHPLSLRPNPLPSADPGLVRGRLKRRRVQRRWGLRPQRQLDEERPQQKSGDEAAGAQSEEEAAEEQSRQREQRGRKRKRAASPAEPESRWQVEGKQHAQALPAASGTAAAGAATLVAAGDSSTAAGAEAGDVPLPVVAGVPAGQVQQLALLPSGRPPCGCCSACASSGDRGCRLVAALKRWDALLPGLSLSDLRQLKETRQRCGRCRSCLVAAHAGGGGGKQRRKGGAVCMALSRVRLGRLQQKLAQLVQERQAWAFAQQLRQRRLGGRRQQGGGGGKEGQAGAGMGSDGDADASPASSSGSEGSNRSRAWLRGQRKRGQEWQQPLPAPDGSLPLPVVPGVPWRRTRELAEAWGEGQPGRCGLCAGCQQQQQHEGGDSDGSPPPGQGQLRCATAAALAAWDRQLGPVTTAAVQAVAAAPVAQRKQARCGCCRQCRQQGGNRQQCATGAALRLSFFPSFLPP